MSWFYSTGAAEDGRAPTEELSCIQRKGLCPTGDQNVSTKNLLGVEGSNGKSEMENRK
jgi:hypothetical protein